MSRARALGAVLVVLALLAAACGDGQNEQVADDTNRDETSEDRGDGVGVTTTTVPFDDADERECSAEGLSASLPEQPLPVLVERTRNAIAAAAAACNFTTLGHLASTGEQQFTFSFGGGTDAAAHWREAEAEGDDVVRRLLELLRLPHAETGEVFVWPSAHAAEPASEDWEALRAVYPDATIAQWRQAGAYLGHRVGIAPDGEWLFYVAGD